MWQHTFLLPAFFLSVSCLNVNFHVLVFSLKSFLRSFWKHTSTEDTLLMLYIFEDFSFPSVLKAFSQDTEFHIVVFISFNIPLFCGTWVNTVSRKNGSQLFSWALTHSRWFPTTWRVIKCFLLSCVVSGVLFCFVSFYTMIFGAYPTWVCWV